MIKFIAAIDSKRGMANEENIPWLGKIPSDTAYYRQKIEDGIILMGYGTYKVISKPYHGRVNYVATNSDEPLREGFEPVKDARAFLQQATGDVWNLGGPGLFASTIDLADELYLTHIEGDFNCTKFFPPYEDEFTLADKSQPITENGITFYFAQYVRRAAA